MRIERHRRYQRSIAQMCPDTRFAWRTDILPQNLVCLVLYCSARIDTVHGLRVLPLRVFWYRFALEPTATAFAGETALSLDCPKIEVLE